MNAVTMLEKRKGSNIKTNFGCDCIYKNGGIARKIAQGHQLSLPLKTILVRKIPVAIYNPFRLGRVSYTTHKLAYIFRICLLRIPVCFG
mgnify:CR=1 FL=1